MAKKFGRSGAFALFVFVGVVASSARSQDALWVLDADGDFATDANWDPAPPFDVSETASAIINNGRTATIAADAGALGSFGGFQLGQAGAETGHIVMEGGDLLLNELEGVATHIGDGNVDAGPDGSTFIMNGGLIVHGPVMADSFSDDWEIGETGFGRMEVHNDSILRIHDDLKVGAGPGGNGFFLIDGEATLTIGSGISVTEGAGSTGTLVISGNATVDSGNSLGSGVPEGTSDEGYLTLSVQADSVATVTVEQNAVFRIRTLAHRGGLTNMTVKDDAQFHIFNLLAGEGEPEAQFESYVGNAPGEMNLNLEGNAVMTITSGLQGLLVGGGGRDPGTNAAGGQATISVRDNASFTVVEGNLNLGIGQTSQSHGILEVVGPDATCQINGDLLMNPMGTEDKSGFARATLRAVITGPTHSTVAVKGVADIQNGEIEVVFNDYTPVQGDSWTLLTGGILGDEFFDEIFPTQEELGGFSLAVDVTADAVVLVVVGVGPFLRGDCNGDLGVDLSDGVALLNFAFLGGAGPPCVVACDFNASGALDITTAVSLFNRLFLGGPALPPPTDAPAISTRASDIALGCAAPSV